jgi:hypothetical protein
VPLLVSLGKGLLLLGHPPLKDLAQCKRGGIMFEIALGGIVASWPTKEGALVSIFLF